MTELANIAMGAIASGALSALGAYAAVVWKLGNRVAVLEGHVKALEDRQDKAERAADQLVPFLHGVKDEITRRLEQLNASLSHQFEQSITTLRADLGVTTKELHEHRLVCSDKHADVVRLSAFNGYVEQQEERWTEFYRWLGRLDQALQNMHPVAPRESLSADLLRK